MSFKMIILIIIAVLFFIFLFQNLASVTVTFLVFEMSMPGSLLLIITVAIGVLIGILSPFEMRKTKKSEVLTDSQKKNPKSL